MQVFCINTRITRKRNSWLICWVIVNVVIINQFQKATSSEGVITYGGLNNSKSTCFSIRGKKPAAYARNNKRHLLRVNLYTFIRIMLVHIKFIDKN